MKLSIALLALTSAMAMAAPLEAQSRTTPPSLSIKNFIRTFPNDSVGIYSFLIDYELGTQWCTIEDPAPSAETHSWYDKGCDEVSSFSFFFLSLFTPVPLPTPPK